MAVSEHASLMLGSEISVLLMSYSPTLLVFDGT